RAAVATAGPTRTLPRQASMASTANIASRTASSAIATTVCTDRPRRSNRRRRAPRTAHEVTPATSATPFGDGGAMGDGDDPAMRAMARYPRARRTSATRARKEVLGTAAAISPGLYPVELSLEVPFEPYRLPAPHRRVASRSTVR